MNTPSTLAFTKIANGFVCAALMTLAQHAVASQLSPSATSVTGITADAVMDSLPHSAIMIGEDGVDTITITAPRHKATNPCPKGTKRAFIQANTDRDKQGAFDTDPAVIHCMPSGNKDPMYTPVNMGQAKIARGPEQVMPKSILEKFARSGLSVVKFWEKQNEQK
jgi:hypothetical protein